jgi:hypothetical protein
MATSKAIAILAQNSGAHFKIIMSKLHIKKNRYICYFMYQTLPAAVCVLLSMGRGGRREREGEPPSQLTPLVGYVYGGHSGTEVVLVREGPRAGGGSSQRKKGSRLL